MQSNNSKTRKGLLEKLDKICTIDKYVIRTIYQNSVVINSSERSLRIYYRNDNTNFKYYLYINNKHYDKFLTRELLLNQLFHFIDLPCSQEVYNICLEKLNIIEELAIITQF